MKTSLLFCSFLLAVVLTTVLAATLSSPIWSKGDFEQTTGCIPDANCQKVSYSIKDDLKEECLQAVKTLQKTNPRITGVAIFCDKKSNTSEEIVCSCMGGIGETTAPLNPAYPSEYLLFSTP